MGDVGKAAFREEFDSMGVGQVPADKYWGLQTERSLQNFAIGNDKMPRELIEAFVILKQAAATTNVELGVLDADKAKLIVAAAQRILTEGLEDNFPLKVWQTGSGTQTNMNVNEVIANLAIESVGGVLGSKDPIHPNDHVNCSQSSNDTFPTAMHIALALALPSLQAAIQELRDSLYAKSQEWQHIVKIGRTHLQDAVPLTLGQYFSGLYTQLDYELAALERVEPLVRELALGGTAVGTGLNAPHGYSKLVAAHITKLTEVEFTTAPNKFQALSAHNAIVQLSGVFKSLGCSLLKIANDLRHLASGPRCGLGEFIMPSNEPGSSIMPGKVNPTQCEALSMVVAQVFGCDTAVTFASSQGNFELNVYKPVIIYNMLHALNLLKDATTSFTKNAVLGLEVNQERVDELLHNSLMLVTALAPHVGYETAAQIAHHAYENKQTLAEAAADLGVMSVAEYNKLVNIADMLGDG